MAATPPIITVMTRAAEKASRSLLRDFGEVQNLQISRKGPGDFVTAADKRAEEIIKDELAYARPDFAFLGEETGRSGDKNAPTWIVDPLDGTLNFLHGLPHWCISIGLEEEGKITAGVIFDPVKDEIFWATKGGGAFMRKSRLRVSARTDLMEALICYGDGRKEADVLLAHQLSNLRKAVLTGTRRTGSAALDLAYVAAGRLDGYWENIISPWDVAAGWIIVKEAGGIVSDMSGKRDGHHSKSVIAANANLHQPLMDLLHD